MPQTCTGRVYGCQRQQLRACPVPTGPARPAPGVPPLLTAVALERGHPCRPQHSPLG